MVDEISGQSVSGIFYLPPMDPEVQAQLEKYLKEFMTISTIGQSESVLPTMGYEAGAPGISSMSFIFSVESEMHEICIGMLDKWNESLHEQAERRQAELNSPAYQAWLETNCPAYIKDSEDDIAAIRASTEFQVYVQTLPPQDRERELGLSRAYSLISGVSNGLNGYLERVHNGDDAAAQAVPFVTASFLIAAGFVGSFMAIAEGPTAGSLGVSPIQEAWSHVANLIPSDMRAELGLIGALFAAGTIYHATIQTIGEGEGGGKPRDVNFAKNYAEQTMKLVMGEEFRNFVMAMLINKTENGKPLDEAQQMKYLATLRAVLLSAALALVYKVEAGEAGRITGQEFADMLKGKIPIPEGDIKGTLVTMIMAQLQFIPEKERVSVIAALIEYMDSNPDVDDLLDPDKVFNEYSLSEEFHGDQHSV